MLGGDFNADGRADLIYSEQRLPAGAPAIFGGWDESTGRFLPRATFEYASHLGSAADINGDGFQDLILDQETRMSGSLRALHTYVVYGGSSLGDGGVSEIPVSVLGTGASFARTRTAAYSVGDLNGDGYGDILFTDTFEDRVFVLRGGRGGPEQTPSLQFDAPRPSDGFGLEPGLAADINGDQLVDFAYPTLNRRSVRLFLGDRERIAVFYGEIVDPTPPGDIGAFSRGFAANLGPSADTDGDGRAEFAVPCEDCVVQAETWPRVIPGRLYMFQEQGDGGIGLLTTLQGTLEEAVGFSGFGVGDLNGDGYDDIGSASYPASGRLLVLWGGMEGISMSRRSILMSTLFKWMSSSEPGFGYVLALRLLGSRRSI
jgi:hypothetical protein